MPYTHEEHELRDNEIVEDTRNVLDEFKGMSEAEISKALDERGAVTEIAIENTLRDFNMGTIVRTANAFGIRTVHVVGRRQWNKRGAMMTDKYLKVVYHSSVSGMRVYANDRGFQLIAIDNTDTAVPLSIAVKEPRSILWFGQEGPGLSDQAVAACDGVVKIEQRGSTRSLNVGVAAGIVMHEWTQGLTE